MIVVYLKGRDGGAVKYFAVSPYLTINKYKVSEFVILAHDLSKRSRTIMVNVHYKNSLILVMISWSSSLFSLFLPTADNISFLSSSSSTILHQIYNGQTSNSDIGRRIFLTAATGGAIIIIGSYCQKTLLSSRKSKQQTVVSVSGALPLIGHIFQMSWDPVTFIKQCKSKYGPVFRIQLPINNEYYVLTGSLVPELLAMPEKVASFHDAVQRMFPTKRVLYTHYEHKCNPDELNDDDAPTILFGQKKLKGSALRVFDDRMKQAINEMIHHQNGLGLLRPGEEIQINDLDSIIEKTMSYMYSICFYGTRHIDNYASLLQNMKNVKTMFRKAAPVYHVFPFCIADQIVRRFYSVEKYLDTILEQVLPLVEGLQSGSIPDEEEATYVGMLLKSPVMTDKSTRSTTEAALRVTRIFTTTGAPRVHLILFMLYELASRPDLVQELRNEITKTEGGKWTGESLSQIPLLDSFIRESLRSTSHTFMHFRVAQKDLTLSTNHFIPKGSILAAASDNVHKDHTMGPSLSGVPLDQFDPYRYIPHYNSTGVKNKNNNDYCDPTRIGNSGYYVFGSGLHPCRGRHYIVQEMKFVLAEIITHYDFRTLSGNRGEDRFQWGIARTPPTEPMIFKRI
ncbi:cytochrome P450 [Phascolomyces articulosus]|uniref:Cytochrome P450 n=1 Tax=Phascolomyces articulosus TaxID=60185 RepID=A0AAD5KPJ6_9FUNG|nr:cytochrome P450 [Phascolomyces articulosus]